MHGPRRFLIPLLIILALAAVGIWTMFQARQAQGSSQLEASGSVEAVEVAVGPETGGRVVDVLVRESDAVRAGDVLFRLDDELLKAQRERASAALDAARAGQASAQSALEMAKAGLKVAGAGVDAAQVQVEMAVQKSRSADLPARADAWKKDLPAEFTQPAWYFQKSEEILAAQAEVTATLQILDTERASYEKVLQDLGDSSLKDAERRLSKAEAAFQVAQDVLDRATAQPDKEVRDYAQSIFDAAKSELDAAQTEYERMLSSETATDVREARARLAVAEERYQAARDRLDGLLTGEDALQVRAAEAARKQAETLSAQAEVGVKQAEAVLGQADKAVAQAQAEMDVIDVQMGKLTIRASTTGVILTRDIEPGEVVQAGATVLVIGQLDRLKITVYLPEDRYGQVKQGEKAQVSVDSFPGQIFPATVARIADRAEYTPRNVQTDEGRRTTVFAVELSVDNPQGRLKPGMPADVAFTE